MSESAMSRNIENLILRRLANVGQKVLAEALECDISRISRFSSGDATIKLAELGPLFAMLGLTVMEVGGNSETLPSEELRAIKILARKGLRLDD